MQAIFGKYKMVYRHLWVTFGGTWQVRLSYVLQLLTRICKLIVLPIAISLIITHLSKQEYHDARNAVFFFVAFSSLLGFLTPLVKYIGMRGENKVYRELTAQYFVKLLAVDIEYFNSNLSGYLTTATRQYADGCIQLVRTLRDRYMTTILSIVFPIGVIMYLDVQLGMVALVLSIANSAYMTWASHAIGPYRTASRELFKQNSGRMADIVSNILAVKSTAQEASYVEKVREGANKEGAAYTKRYTIQAKLFAAREAITVMVFAVLFLLTVSRMSQGAITLTTAVLVITYAATILTGVYSLSDDLDEHDDIVDRIIPAFEILERQNLLQDPANPKPFKDHKGVIEFKNVFFSYEQGKKYRPVLEDFSILIPDGQKVGVVGISGAGKSTLTKLLLRFNDVDSGQVLINGVNIREMLQTELRKHLAYVPQEPLLFHTSIKDNVVLSNPKASDNEVNKALKAAHALEFVETLPDGLDSVVGERGVKLSGGQKQRVAIARAVLQHAPIMVLDEATSALDSESEQIIKKSFGEVLKGRTAIVVAHRLSTLSEMDRVIVLDKGKLVEDGTHDELIAKHGLYAKLWQRQQNSLLD